MRPGILALAVLTGLAACQMMSDRGPPVETAATVQPSGPLEGVEDPYELAGRVPLEPPHPQDWDDLSNVHHLSSNIISGSEPQGEEALRRLSEMGVKTLVSVDGKVPDHETAARYGMRYVHIPIQYKGLTDDELMRLVKTFRELEPPFFVHCFHGRHRGPAAAALGRVVCDGAPREEVLAEMRQWCGTAEKYKGLYEAVAKTPIPPAEKTRAYAYGFPPAKELSGFRSLMIEAARILDRLKILAANGWEPDSSHPDLDAGNEAAKLAGLFKRSWQLGEVRDRSGDFRSWLRTCTDECGRLKQVIHGLRDGSREAAGKEAAADAFGLIQKSCRSCHRSYRNT